MSVSFYKLTLYICPHPFLLLSQPNHQQTLNKMLNGHRKAENSLDRLIRTGVVFLFCPQRQPHNTMYCFIFLSFQQHTKTSMHSHLQTQSPIYLPCYLERLMSTSSCLLYFLQRLILCKQRQRCRGKDKDRAGERLEGCEIRMTAKERDSFEKRQREREKEHDRYLHSDKLNHTSLLLFVLGLS